MLYVIMLYIYIHLSIHTKIDRQIFEISEEAKIMLLKSALYDTS